MYKVLQDKTVKKLTNKQKVNTLNSLRENDAIIAGKIVGIIKYLGPIYYSKNYSNKLNNKNIYMTNDHYMGIECVTSLKKVDNQYLHAGCYRGYRYFNTTNNANTGLIIPSKLFTKKIEPIKLLKIIKKQYETIMKLNNKIKKIEKENDDLNKNVQTLLNSIQHYKRKKNSVRNDKDIRNAVNNYNRSRRETNNNNININKNNNNNNDVSSTVFNENETETEMGSNNAEIDTPVEYLPNTAAPLQYQRQYASYIYNNGNAYNPVNQNQYYASKARYSRPSIQNNASFYALYNYVPYYYDSNNQYRYLPYYYTQNNNNVISPNYYQNYGMNQGNRNSVVNRQSSVYTNNEYLDDNETEYDNQTETIQGASERHDSIQVRQHSIHQPRQHSIQQARIKSKKKLRTQAVPQPRLQHTQVSNHSQQKRRLKLFKKNSNNNIPTRLVPPTYQTSVNDSATPMTQKSSPYSDGSYKITLHTRRHVVSKHEHIGTDSDSESNNTDGSLAWTEGDSSVAGDSVFYGMEQSTGFLESDHENE